MRSTSRRLVPLATLVALLLLAGADPSEDEAHRVDRLRTRELNEAALKGAAPSAPAPPAASRPLALPGVSPEDGALRVREERALAAWRARVAACRAGDRKSCER